MKLTSDGKGGEVWRSCEPVHSSSGGVSVTEPQVTLSSTGPLTWTVSRAANSIMCQTQRLVEVRPKGLKLEVQRVKSGGFLRREAVSHPPHQLGVLGKCCKLPSEVQAEPRKGICIWILEDLET